MLKTIKDWDDEFANMAHIPGSEILPKEWDERAALYRANNIKIGIDIPYGDHPRERMDIVWPDNTPKGLVVFIHGGFWMWLDKSYWTDLAEGARVAGWAVCLPSYTLAPHARIAQMTHQIARAIEYAAARVAGPIRITGHSAGGHLATRMICDDTPLTLNTIERIKAVQSISGLHDLRPLMQTQMNATLNLDEKEASQESPVLRRPLTGIPYTAWVGGNERPEFIRQSKIITKIWDGLDAPSRYVIDGHHNHFTVIDNLRVPTSPLVRNLLGIFSKP